MLRDGGGGGGGANVNLSIGNQTAASASMASPSSALSEGANTSEPKLHSILCSRTSAWASRIYETSGSEGNSMQRAELALRQALQALPSSGEAGGEPDGGDESREIQGEDVATASPDTAAEKKFESSESGAGGVLEEQEEQASTSGSGATGLLGGLTGGNADGGGRLDGTGGSGMEPRGSADGVGQDPLNRGAVPSSHSPRGVPSHSSFGHMTPLVEEKSHISWKCGVCGYHVLAMDQNGHPLPLSRGAYGELLPIRCPQCEMEHTSWEQAIPFDKHGDHVNIRSTLSNNYVTKSRKPEKPSSAALPPVTSAAPPSPVSGATGIHHAPPPPKRELPPILANIGRVTYRDGVPVPNHVKPRQTPEVRMAFYCSLCGRRLLRVDSEGELVAMDRDAKGEVLPIRCPGCSEVHNKWVVKPFTVGRIRVSGDAIDTAHAHGGQKEKGKGVGVAAAGSCVEPLPTW